MVELGLYGIARVYWSMFGNALGHRGTMTAAFLGLGVLTTMVGAMFCFRQRHLKRLLAFSTISHAGMFLVGLGLLTPLGLAGAAVYVVGHGLVKAALFLCTGIVLHRLGSVNETWLHGRARHLRVTGIVFVLAGLALADLPPFTTYLGKGYIEASGATSGMVWITAVLLISSILVGGAVLRAGAGIFYGLGDPPPEDPRMAQTASEEKSETEAAKQRTPTTMILPPIVLVIMALALGLSPRLGAVVQAQAVRLEDQSAYNATVLSGVHVSHPVATHAPEPTGVTAVDVATGAGSAAGSVVLALLALYWRRLPLRRRAFGPELSLAGPARAFQSGVVGDYVTWMVVGAACLGGALAFAIH
jgi:multicomponent Na+:H+ antiporter subunit D